MTSFLLFIALLFGLLRPVASIRLWDSPASIPAVVPASCRATLSTDIQCGPRFIRGNEVVKLDGLDSTVLLEYCNSTCTRSLEDWAKNVDTRCGSTPHDWGFNISRSGNDIAKPLLWAHKVACLTDKKTKEFCFKSLVDKNTAKCADCRLQYLAEFVNNEYAPGMIEKEDFLGLLSSCSISPTLYPIPSTTGSGGRPIPTGGTARRCIGRNYTVASTDSCTSIASKNGMAIDHFLEDNGIDFKCQSLRPGATVCIGDKCALHQVKRDETCADLLRDNNFSLAEFLAWNPVIHSSCDNLASLEGRTICVSPPGTNSYNDSAKATWSETWTTPSGSWVSAPTVGTNAPNNTVPFIVTEVPTVTITGNATAASEYSKYVTHCPVDDEVIEQGFEWDLLDDNCKSLLEPYCSPLGSGKVLSSTTFPSSCMPSVVLGLE